jgi:succinate dehydrogenase / fumarate reductase, flavoprotein subunit
MDVAVIGGSAQGIIVRNLLTGRLERHAAHAVVLATGGYGNAFYLSTNAMSGNVTATWRAHRRGAAFANPCFVQIHPTCIPVHGEYQSKIKLISESLRNNSRVWVPKDADQQSTAFRRRKKKNTASLRRLDQRRIHRRERQPFAHRQIKIRGIIGKKLLLSCQSHDFAGHSLWRFLNNLNGKLI